MLKNGRRIYRNIVMMITSLLLAVILLPHSFFAAQHVSGTFSGSLTYIPEKKLISDLSNAGFEVATDNRGNIIYTNGNITLNSNVPDDLGSLFEALFSNQRHTALKNSGILSYEVYENQICDEEIRLVIILDFSAYGVGVFSADSMQGMRAALAGGLFSKFTETAPLYDSNTGESLGTARLSLGGFGGLGSSSMTKTVNGSTSSSISLRGFTLRIIPPSGCGTITFKTESITFNELLLNPPTIVEFDLTRFADIDKLIIENNITGSRGSNHLHILSREDSDPSYEIMGNGWTVEEFNRIGTNRKGYSALA